MEERERGHSCPLYSMSLSGVGNPPLLCLSRGLENPRSFFKLNAENDVMKKQESGVGKPPLPSGPFFNSYAETLVTKNHLPHWQQGHVWCFVTWRLADSLPKAKLDQWNTERSDWLKQHPEPWDEEAETAYHEKFSRQIDEWLDQGGGSCVLRDLANASIVAEAMRHFDGERYEIASFVVMPNHVHVLFRPLGGHVLADIVKSWKGFRGGKSTIGWGRRECFGRMSIGTG